MFNSRIRSTLPEIMDQVDLSEKDVVNALNDIEKVNIYLGGYKVVLDALNQLKWDKSSFSILDIGSGGGDTLKAIAKWAIHKNVKVKLIGIDINPIMTKHAQLNCKDFPNISFETCNVFDLDQLKHKTDIVLCNLFCHHFNDMDLVTLLKRMNDLSSAKIIINDLHRHWFAYYSIKFITKFFSNSYMVKYDAPLSVARSLTKVEWFSSLKFAGFTDFKIKWCWAWRWQIIINK